MKSLDLEFTSAKPSRVRDAGRKSIQAIIDNTEADLISSNEQAKNLQLTIGTAKAQEQHAPWSNRFRAFRQHTLQVE